MEKIRFITGSRYEGDYKNNWIGMSGFGTYVYPDGSQYRGYFSNGQFHGYGNLTTMYPVRTTFRGLFLFGKFVQIEEILCDDDLKYNFMNSADDLNFNDWNYLTKNDRRYSHEMFHLAAVVPDAVVTRTKPERYLKPREYDVEEGIYNKKTRFITNRIPPLKPMRYVGCLSEMKWIHQNCRSGSHRNHLIALPNRATCQRILEANLESDESLYQSNPCSCDSKLQCEAYVKYLQKILADIRNKDSEQPIAEGEEGKEATTTDESTSKDSEEHETSSLSFGKKEKTQNFASGCRIYKRLYEYLNIKSEDISQSTSGTSFESYKSLIFPLEPKLKDGIANV